MYVIVQLVFINSVDEGVKTMPNNVVAIYGRLSEEDKNKLNTSDYSESIKNQKNMLTDYADEKGWLIYDYYFDDDYAGADRNRPEYKRLLEDAKNKRFGIILCKTQSRFTRELEIVEKYLHGYFPLWGIRFVSIVDNADTANKGNKKARQINGLVNEWYLEDMSDNIKSVLENKHKQGLHTGGICLYGYKKDPNRKGHLIIDEEPAEIVREVFALYANGYGKTAIARILNERNVPNPTAYKQSIGINYKKSYGLGSLWKYYAIDSMLHNEMYIGNMVQGRYGSVSYKTKKNKPKPKSEWIIVKNTHKPIIDKTLWEQVQSKINANFKPFNTGEIGVFAKKAKCMYCNYTLRSSKNREKRYLKCETRHFAKTGCQGAFVSQDELANIVLQEFKKLTQQYVDMNDVESKISINNDLAKKQEILKNKIASCFEKIEESNNIISNMYADKVKGFISENDFLSMIKKFNADKSELEKEKNELQEHLNLILVNNEKLLNRKEVLEQYIHVDELTKEIMDIFVESIFVGKRERRNLTPPVEIHWTF